MSHKPLLSSHVDAVLFDLDGTLLDTAPDFATTLNSLLNEKGLPSLPFKEIRETVSHGARALVNLGFGLEPSHPDFAHLHQRLLELYYDNLTAATQPFPGVEELLLFLDRKNIPWGIVTNKPVRYTEPLMQVMNFSPTYTTLVCPEHVTNTKPHPEPLLLACEQIGNEPKNTIYIGDHQRDIAAGQAAGMLTIAASYGYLAEQEDISAWGADYVVTTTLEIIPIIEQLLISEQA